MKVFTEYLLVIFVLAAVLLFVTWLHGDIKARAKRIVDDWIREKNLEVSPENISIQMFSSYPLQAVIIGTESNGDPMEYTLRIGGSARGSILPKAELLKKVPYGYPRYKNSNNA